MAISNAGTPFVAWHEDVAGNREIFVAQFDGAAWVKVGAGSMVDGGISNNAGGSMYPKIALGCR